MYPRAHLLGIASELRLQIYREYVTVDGGYCYSPQTRKMTKPDGQNISLGLMFTCKLIAEEMVGLPFNENSIRFSTASTEELRTCAGEYNSILETIRRGKTEAVFQLARCLRPSMREIIARDCPEFVSVHERIIELEELEDTPFASALRDEPLRFLWQRAVHSGYTFGKVPSDFRRFATRLCQLVANEPGHIDAYPYYAESIPGSKPFPSKFRKLSSIPDEPWTIPSRDQVRELAKDLDLVPDIMHESNLGVEKALGSYPCRCFKPLDQWSSWRFSAAAVCIQFLGSLSATVRKAIRRIILLENHESVAHPECHAQGLITFCQENLRLHIERRVSLWRNVLQTANVHRVLDRECVPPFSRAMYEDENIPAHSISRAVTPWIVEAHSLNRKGMPKGSFQLALDGDPIPERTTKVFSIVLRDAAYQTARARSHELGLIRDPLYHSNEKNTHHQFTDLPQLVNEMIHGTNEMIICNFDLDETEDSEYYIQKGVSWTEKEWGKNWEGPDVLPDPSTFKTTFPLPPWMELLKEEHPCDVPYYMNYNFNVRTWELIDRAARRGL
jgi:hypothetical protein